MMVSALPSAFVFAPGCDASHSAKARSAIPSPTDFRSALSFLSCPLVNALSSIPLDDVPSMMSPAVGRLEVPFNYSKYLWKRLRGRPTHRPRGADRRCVLVRDVEVAAARAMTARDWLTELDPIDEVAALPSPAGGELVGGSAAWPDDYREVKGWSEGTGLLQEAMEEADDENREGPAGRPGAGDDTHHGVCLGEDQQGPGKRGTATRAWVSGRKA